MADLFMQNSSYLVDLEGHSAFCLEAQHGGLISADDLHALTLYPNGYGLHLLTTAVATKAAGRIRLKREVMLTEERASAIVGRLAKPFTELPYASRIALACAEGGLLSEEVLGPIVARVIDCGSELLSAAELSLDALLPEEQRLERNRHDGKVYEECVIGTEIQGEHFHLCAWDRNVFTLDIPEISDDYVEVHILLVKTLDAMSSCLIPFSTPASILGPNGQYAYGVGEVYEHLSERLDMGNPEAIAQYLETVDGDSCEVELEYLGLSFHDLPEGESFDPDLVAHAASLLTEMHDVETNYGYRIDHTQEGRKCELEALITQADDTISEGSQYDELLKTLREALQVCRHEEDRGFSFDETEFPGSAEDGMRFFDCIWVEARHCHPALTDEALEGFNAYAQDCAQVSVGLPIGSAELVAHTTVPIMERTQQCLSLLRRIQLSLEVISHA